MKTVIEVTVATKMTRMRHAMQKKHQEIVKV